MPVGAVLDVLQGLVMVLFWISGIVLIFVVLIQEGKGGGIAGAFGGAGAEAFGVKAGTVNRFTAYVGTAFLLLALLHAGLASRTGLGGLDNLNRPSALTDEPPAPPSAAPIPPVKPPDGDTPPEPVPGSVPGGIPPGEPTTPPAAPPGSPPAPAPEEPRPPGEPVPTPPAPAPAPAPAPGEPPPPAMER
jgi:protein translocase SecG subunit